MLSLGKDKPGKEQDESGAESLGQDVKARRSRASGKHRRQRRDKTSAIPNATVETAKLTDQRRIGPIDLDTSRSISEGSGFRSEDKSRSRHSKNKTSQEEKKHKTSKHRSRSKQSSKERKHKPGQQREKATIVATSVAEQSNVIQEPIPFLKDVTSSSSTQSSARIMVVPPGGPDSDEDTSEALLSTSSTETKANQGSRTLDLSFFPSPATSSSCPVSSPEARRRKLRNPTYTEYVFMAHLAYLQEEQDEEDVGHERDSQVLTRLAKNTLGIEVPGGENWQMISCPDGSFVSGYIGTIFIHRQRQQIVIAHAGTLPGRVKTLLADLQGVVLKKQNPLVLDAIMQSQDLIRTQGLGVDLQSLVQQGYHLSFTGHSLGGFLAEMSVFACHRGFGFHYPAANAVVFDSPGSLEVIEAWQSNLPLQHIDIKQLNIVSFLSSPNIVNTLYSHPGTVYRMIREIRTSTFSSYLMNSHSRVKMASLFEAEMPRSDAWVEMDSWPLANYEELLSLRDKPLDVINIVVRNTLELALALPDVIINAVKRRSKGLSIQRIVGGGEVASWWRQVGVEEPRDYHIYFDTSTSIGLKHAQETGYSVKLRGSLAVGNFLPFINIKPATLRFLITHQDYRTRAHYVSYLEARALPPLHELPLYEINREHNVIYMMDQHSHHDLFSLIDNVETMLMRHQELFDLERSYLHYVEYAIEQAMQAIEHTASENAREAFAQVIQLRTEMLSLIAQASARLPEQTVGLVGELHLRGAVAAVPGSGAVKFLTDDDFKPLSKEELELLRAQLQPGGKLYIATPVATADNALALNMAQGKPIDPSVQSFAMELLTLYRTAPTTPSGSNHASSRRDTSQIAPEGDKTRGAHFGPF